VPVCRALERSDAAADAPPPETENADGADQAGAAAVPEEEEEEDEEEEDEEEEEEEDKETLPPSLTQPNSSWLYVKIDCGPPIVSINCMAVGAVRNAARKRHFFNLKNPMFVPSQSW
jgi:hypothetical protein